MKSIAMKWLLRHPDTDVQEAAAMVWEEYYELLRYKAGPLLKLQESLDSTRLEIANTNFNGEVIRQEIAELKAEIDRMEMP